MDPFQIPDEMANTPVYWTHHIKVHTISMLIIVVVLFPIQMLLHNLDTSTSYKGDINYSMGFKCVLIILILVSSVHAFYFIEPNPDQSELGGEVWHTLGFTLVFFILFFQIAFTLLMKYRPHTNLCNFVYYSDIAMNWFLLPYTCMMGYANVCLGVKFIRMSRGQVAHPLIGLMYYNYGSFLVYNMSINPQNIETYAMNKLVFAENLFFTALGAFCFICFHIYAVMEDQGKSERYHQADFEHQTMFLFMCVSGVISSCYHVLHSLRLVSYDLRNRFHGKCISFALLGIGIGIYTHGSKQPNHIMEIAHMWLGITMILAAIARFLDRVFLSGFCLIFFGISAYFSGGMYTAASSDFWRMNVYLHFVGGWILAFILGNTTSMLSQVQSGVQRIKDSKVGDVPQYTMHQPTNETQPFLNGE